MSEPVWIEDDLVLAIHDRLLVEHGGAGGLRDESLLQSALARPLNHVAYASSDIIELAAKYTTGIVQNHPFIDGNKRTGFVIGVLFLELNAISSQPARKPPHKPFSNSLRAQSTRTRSANSFARM
jgi:death on curing protein